MDDPCRTNCISEVVFRELHNIVTKSTAINLNPHSIAKALIIHGAYL